MWWKLNSFEANFSSKHYKFLFTVSIYAVNMKYKFSEAFYVTEMVSGYIRKTSGWTWRKNISARFCLILLTLKRDTRFKECQQVQPERIDLKL